MFTGIIQQVVPIVKSSLKSGLLDITIKKSAGRIFHLGDSIALDGVCLTVKKITKTGYEMSLMPETLKKTTFGLSAPRSVNFEPCLRAGDMLGGHVVLGHIDAVGSITHTARKGGTAVYKIAFPSKFRRLIAPKGSIAVDGISLTIVDAGKNWFIVALIPYTLAHTTIGAKRNGDYVNLEFDMMAKYINSAIKSYAKK